MDSFVHLRIMRLLILSFSLILLACNSSEQKTYEDKRFVIGEIHEQTTLKAGEYSLKKGFLNDSTTASLKLSYNNKEIYYETKSDGFYGDIIQCNLNNDGIPDFLISFEYEDGASLYGLLSKAKTTFENKLLFSEWSETHCITSADTLIHILPLQIKDIDNDGKEDIISNLVGINNQTFAISCTDTVFGGRIE